MAGLVEKFENWKQKTAQRKQTRKNDKFLRGKSISDFIERSQLAEVDRSKYRENYRAIFSQGKQVGEKHDGVGE